MRKTVECKRTTSFGGFLPCIALEPSHHRRSPIAALTLNPSSLSLHWSLLTIAALTLQAPLLGRFFFFFLSFSLALLLSLSRHFPSFHPSLLPRIRATVERPAHLGGTSSNSGEMIPEAYWKKLLPSSFQPFLPPKAGTLKKESEGRGWQALLRRRTAEAFPFSVSKLDSILNLSRTHFYSSERRERNTRGLDSILRDVPGVLGRFRISQLKTNDVRLLSTSILDKGTAAKGRVYTVPKGVTEFPYKDSVVCHVLGYPYGVFYFHKTINTSSYVLPLVAEEDGSKVDAGAVCHTETSSSNPKHASFQTLGVKPGVPICHFLPYGHFVWVANSAP
ncbi:hypothetical protein EJ110_NYTH07643 [Nymphaea thermarum]|nr:hypothetical protein EJ110_NYTH07643 [Nymphaea thermarum]